MRFDDNNTATQCRFVMKPAVLIALAALHAASAATAHLDSTHVFTKPNWRLYSRRPEEEFAASISLVVCLSCLQIKNKGITSNEDVAFSSMFFVSCFCIFKSLSVNVHVSYEDRHRACAEFLFALYFSLKIVAIMAECTVLCAYLAKTRKDFEPITGRQDCFLRASLLAALL